MARAKTYESRSSTGSVRRWMLIPIGVALLIAGAAAWTYYKQRYPAWYEEVRLSDGRVITIRQEHEYYENYGTNQSWVEIDLPELGGKKVWHSYLIPQRVDVYQGKVYVFGMPGGDRQYQFYADPKNFLVGFAWDGSAFARIPFLEIPSVVRQEENLYSCIPPMRAQVLSLKLKDKQWCPPKGDDAQFTRRINLPAFQLLAIQYSKRAGGHPGSD